VRIVDGAARKAGVEASSPRLSAAGLEHVLNGYGLRRFLAAVDDGVSFRHANTIVGAGLDWLATEGFSEMLKAHGNEEFATPAEFRGRYVLGAFRELVRALRGQ
jgi:hypothetical protein